MDNADRVTMRGLRGVLLGMTVLGGAAAPGLAGAAVPWRAGIAAPTNVTAAMQSLFSRIPAGAGAPALTDLGAPPDGTLVGLTFYLYPSNPTGLANFVSAVQTPGNPSFHQFMTRAQFVAACAPTAATISQVEQDLAAEGFTATGVFANNLAISVTTTAANVKARLGVTLHQMSRAGTTGLVSTTPAVIAAPLAPFVRGVGGLDTLLRPDSAFAQGTPSTKLSNAALAPSLGIGDTAGALTPADYEKLYDVNPLVQAGATGAGVTVAILTEENFPTSDPPAFWNTVKVTVGADHLATPISVDGGTSASPPSGDANETDLDVEQSGAIAPDATVQAYVAPNTGRGLVDGFEQAASDNTASVVSLSFDTPEVNYLAAIDKDSPVLRAALHDVLSEMAAQGQTVFVAAGDAGAFGANRRETSPATGQLSTAFYPVFPTPGGPAAYTPIYSVGTYTADPLVTACGGTTLPFTASYNGFSIGLGAEQPWSYSYYVLDTLAQGDAIGSLVPLFETVFPAGGAGGVSILNALPPYQQNLAGVVTTAAYQALYQFGGAQPTLLTSLPAGLAGRNLPDVSANADPNTGYLRTVNGTTYDNGGGTSYVAPQFAGTMALMVQLLGHRVGQLNPLLYALQAKGAGAARDITSGDNWGYLAHAGYDQATGLGAMDGERLYLGLKSFD